MCMFVSLYRLSGDWFTFLSLGFRGNKPWVLILERLMS